MGSKKTKFTREFKQEAIKLVGVASAVPSSSLSYLNVLLLPGQVDEGPLTEHGSGAGIKAGTFLLVELEHPVVVLVAVTRAV